MRRATLVLSLLLALALVGPAASQEHAAAPHDGAVAPAPGAPAGSASASPARKVSIGFDSLRPERIDVVTGETVTWTNDSARAHTVTADDGSFDSGRFGAGLTFSRRFATAAEFPYHCRLHPSIRGVAAVHDLLLDAPAFPASPKTAFPLTGRASLATLAAGTEVSLEADTGEGFTAVASTTLQADGAFSARLPAPAGGSYRAVAGGVTSAPVNLIVLDRRISLSAKRVASRVVLRTTVTPASPGGRVVLQLYLPERFGWWPVRSAKLDARSAATFDVRTRRRLRVRVRLTLPDEATPLATSRTLRIGPTLRSPPHRSRGHAAHG